jgi:hypothetical protein
MIGRRPCSGLWRRGLLPNEFLRKSASGRGGTCTDTAIVRGYCTLLANLAAVLLAVAARAEVLTDHELSKAARNPLPNLIIVPLQNNTNLDYGPGQGVQDGINIQPLVSFRIGPDWNLITRTVVPLIFNPDLGRTRAEAGVGDIQLTSYLSSSALTHWTWGIGPVVQLPTHTHRFLGNDNVGLGPAIAGLYLEKGNPWVIGGLASTVWSLGTNAAAPRYSAGSLQPLISYHLDDGLYLTSSPIIKINWLARPEHQILLPVGGGIGKVLHLGKMPVNAEIAAYYNVMRRELDADWQLRLQLQFVFPR